MTDHLRTLAGSSPPASPALPNAGLPDENGHYEETPEMLARTLRRFVEQGWVNVVGGCCGTTPAHIRALAAADAGRAPRGRPRPRPRASVSGVDYLELDDVRPVIVGERTNVIGSRSSRSSSSTSKFEEASEIGRAQVRGGAQVLDVCLANPDRDELADMDRFLRWLVKKVKAPLDDRLHRRAGARDGAHASPGQGDHQLDQPGGRRGALRAGGAAAAHLRRARWWWAASTRTSSRAWR